MIQPLTIEGAVFEFSLQQQIDGRWHWLMTAPGKLVLSGEAPDEVQALSFAQSAGEALRKMTAA